MAIACRKGLSMPWSGQVGFETETLVEDLPEANTELVKFKSANLLQ